MDEPQKLGEFNGHEIYPMPMFATIAVTDVAAVAAWYEQALGFSSIFRMPSPDGKPSIIHLRRRKYQDILLVPARTAPLKSGTLFLSFNTDGEVDELAVRARGIPPVGQSEIAGPVDTAWNTRDLNVLDPEGNRLVFTARRSDPDPEQAARWKAIFEQSLL
jgi:catechol 2,3-dioxygenase-like lactoylglutathione lyase family enzyme